MTTTATPQAGDRVVDPALADDPATPVPSDNRGFPRPPSWWLWSVLAVTVAQMAVRWWSVMGLDSYHDDIAVTYRALGTNLDADFIFSTYAGHWGPVTRVLEWVTVRVSPFDAGVEFGVVLLILLVADLGMILLLRRMFGAGRLSLVLVVLWAFTPLLATTVGSWSLGLLLLPLVAGMAWTGWLHVVALQTGSRRAQLGAVGLLLLTLLVSPQAVILIGFLVLLTLAYPGLNRRRVTRRMQLRRLSRMWIGYAVVAVAYPIAYLSTRPERSSRPLSWNGLGESIGGLGVSTGVPSLVGGPWLSDPGALPSVGTLSPFLVSLTIQLLVALVVLSVSMRRWAWRAWVVLALLWLGQLVLVATAVRADLVGDQLLRQTRYLVPVIVPTIVLLGAAFAYGAARPWVARLRSRRSWTLVATVGTVLLAVVAAESAWLTNYAQAAAMKTGSTAPFWTNVRAGLANNPTASIVDRPMPGSVLFPGFLPELGRMSDALDYFVTDQSWDSPSADPTIITDDGRLVKARVLPFGRSFPGTAGCGYLVRGRNWVTLKLNQSAFNYGWGVQLNYLAAADTKLEVRAAEAITTVPVARGLGSVTWVSPGEIPVVQVRSAPGESVAVCIDQVVVGGLQPDE